MAGVVESVRIRRFTVEEYHRMAEAGVFAPNERVELIHGEIREMTPKGRKHVVAVTKANRIFQRGLADRVSIYVQDPLKRRTWHSEPEPDLTIISNPDIDVYGTEESTPLLVIEVADTSLEYDRNVKGALYADAGFPEYWIVNVVDDVIEVYREPIGDTYQFKSTYKLGERIKPTAWPELEIEVIDLIPSPTETDE
jgi:Uma2 family endonuclease